MRWTVTPSEGKDSDSRDSRKTHVLTCSVNSFGFFSFFFFLLSPPRPVVVVGFIGTMKSNKLLRVFFSLSHIFYCCYKPLPIYWAVAVLWSFLFFFFLLLFSF